MGFSRQEYWSGLPFPSPGDLPDPGTKPAWVFLTVGRFFTISATREAQIPHLSDTVYVTESLYCTAEIDTTL